MRKENGAISVFVLLSMLFFLTFIMISFSIVQQKGKNQQATTEVLKDIYKSEVDLESIYASRLVEGESDIENKLKTQEQIDNYTNATYIAVDGVIYKK